jgi:hypothetical protein
MGWLSKMLGKGADGGESGAETPGAPANPPIEPAAGVRRFAAQPDPMHDMDRTARLAQLFEVPRERWDAAWQDLFWDAMWSAALEIGTPQVFTGPDGFPYLRFQMPDPEAARLEGSSLANVAPSLVGDHVGFALFADADPASAPLWVASMGVIASIIDFDNPYGDPIDLQEMALPLDPAKVEAEQHQTTLRVEQEVLISGPSNAYISPASAAGLHRHLVEGWKIADPRVALLIAPHLRPMRSLVIGKRVSDFAREGIPEQQMLDQVRMLSWYLPPSRMLMLMPESLDDNNLVPLAPLAA